MEISRVVIIVLDSLGIGALPDASDFGDAGSNTLKSVVEKAGFAVKLENLTGLGLGLIEGVDLFPFEKEPGAHFGRMMELSPGKDTITGHLEMAGIVLKTPFTVYSEGFSDDILKRFTLETGYGFLFGKAASGTEIIERLGAEHKETKKPIVYTSADSVFQIAAHEDIISVDELYKICALSRAFLDEYNIGRVIARPFTGEPGSVKRTAGRKDFSMAPGEKTVLERLKEKGVGVTAIGKIGDIYAHRGFTREIHTTGNREAMNETLKAVKREGAGLIFSNLVDFDMCFGHRRDPGGYARALLEFDSFLPDILSALRTEDLLIITADHGCDPAFHGTDHTREYVPLLVYNKVSSPGCSLGTRKSFSDIAQSVAEIFSLESFVNGESFFLDIVNAT
ncbi:MAG: phosphopentomutase [Thermodesulfobacteriota bacterium]